MRHRLGLAGPTTATVIKSQEKTGPRIPKPEFFFESIPSKSGLEPKHHTDQFDPEPNEREHLEADGWTCTRRKDNRFFRQDHSQTSLLTYAMARRIEFSGDLCICQ